jgi:4-amino-4-deoxy-L-arabinose transferase-like glycosyltransferase
MFSSSLNIGTTRLMLWRTARAYRPIHSPPVTQRAVTPDRPDRYIALVLAIVTAASRLPFMAERLWEWDSVLYARALEQGFHVDEVLPGMRPHPPGYIFYVASAAIGRLLGLDSDHALVAVSVVASGVAVAATYLLCRRFAGRTISLALAIAFAAAPLVWLHGEVAMPYIVLAPVTALLALAFRDARDGSARRVIGTSFAFGALAGFRQDLLLFLFPLWVWMLWPTASRARLQAAGALLAGCLLWFIPSAVLSDGPVAYVTRTVRQLVSTSAVSANAERSLAVNAVLVGHALLWAGLGLSVLLLVVGLARALASARGLRRPDDREAVFFGLWLLPPLAFYLFVHIGEWGFVLSMVPGMYVLLAWLLDGVTRARAASALILANAAVCAFVFLTGDDPVFSRASLVGHDRATEAKTEWIRTQAPPSSIVVAGAEVLVASYYLPDRIIRYSNAAATTTYEVPIAGPTTIVIYEPAARPPDLRVTRTVEIIGGLTLDLADVTSGTLRLRGADIGDTRR